MSPILVRPVREQLEHDRVIRLLQAKYKRKFEVAINPGNEQAVPVGSGPSPWFPDLVLQSTDRAHRLMGVVEVETAESVNNLEAMSQWASLARLRAPFHLYVPASSIDSARRLCADFQIPVAEIWAFHPLGDQLRFTLMHRGARADAKEAPAASARAGSPARRPRPDGRAAARPAAARPVRRPATRRKATTSGAARRSSAKAKASRSTARPKRASGASRAQKRK